MSTASDYIYKFFEISKSYDKAICLVIFFIWIMLRSRITREERMKTMEERLLAMKEERNDGIDRRPWSQRIFYTDEEMKEREEAKKLKELQR
jgi:hypothetical protein